MAKLAFLVLCFIFAPVFTYAQNPGEADIVIVKETPNAIYEGSSEHNRIGKKYQLSLMPVGVGPAFVIWTGLNFGYSVDRNSLFLLSLNDLNKYSRTCTGDYTCGISGSSLAVSYKKFVNNSFYFTSGASYRKIKYNESENFGSVSDYAIDFEGNAIALDFSIGNQWQWQNFTLGCDWIGGSLPISNRIETENITGNLSNGQTNLDDRKNMYFETFSLSALNFYIGASF
ncbi:hypothetical protein D3C87_1063300 [compost metagenome]